MIEADRVAPLPRRRGRYRLDVTLLPWVAAQNFRIGELYQTRPAGQEMRNSELARVPVTAVTTNSGGGGRQPRVGRGHN